MVTDVAKMYRQILVHTDDRDVQRILWWRNTSFDVREYCLSTVTYGVRILAIQTLHQLAEEEQSRYFPWEQSL